MTNAEWIAQEARIEPLYRAGCGRHEIARKTGLGESTVARRLKRLREAWGSQTAPAAGPDAETARMIYLHVEEGLNARQVALRCGVTRDKVESRLKKAGVYRPQPAEKPLPVLPEAMREHVPHACSLARNTLKRLTLPDTSEYSQEDWYSLARFFALRALADYRRDKGCAWQSWVIARVRWDLGEELRRTSPYTRWEWRQLREEAFAADPGLAEPVRRGEWEEREMDLVAARRPVSWEHWCAEREPDDWKNESWRRAHVREEECPAEPETWLEIRAVRDAVAALPVRLRYVVQRRQEEYTLLEISSMLGLSESRIQQLEMEAHGRLREVLAEWA